MKIFSMKKYNNRIKFEFMGIKISFKVSNKAYKENFVQNIRIQNMMFDKLYTLADKRKVIEQMFMLHENSYFPNIDAPSSFNEKIQWLNLYYHNPILTKITDKVSFKEYIKNVIGDEYIVPTLGVYNDANEIDFNNMPSDYVLKSNWGGDSSQVLLVRAKDKISFDKIKTIANSWLLPTQNLYYYAFNWCYRDIKPKLIAEQMLKPKDGILYDYKFMCFNGKPQMAFVVYDRYKNMRLDFFDMNWNRLDFKRKYKNSKKAVRKPKNFDKMVELATILSKPFPFVRVDFYEVDGKLYIGELTFTPGGGFEAFQPVEWDYKLGSMIDLPEKILDERDRV